MNHPQVQKPMRVETYTVYERHMRPDMQYLAKVLALLTLIDVCICAMCIRDFIYRTVFCSTGPSRGMSCTWSVVYLGGITDFIILCAHTDVNLDFDDIALLYLCDALLGRRWNVFNGLYRIYEAMNI